MYVSVIMYRHVNIGKCTGATCQNEPGFEGRDVGRGDLGVGKKE